jgi:hypothetical protein
MRKYLLAALITFAGGTLANAQTLDQQEQERCAADAKRAYQDGLGEEGIMSGSDWGKPMVIYQSHYNVKTRSVWATDHPSPHLRVRKFPELFEISFRFRGYSGKRLLASSSSLHDPGCVKTP